MALVLLAGIIALLGIAAFWKTPSDAQRPFPWAAVFGCALALLFVRLGLKWAPLLLLAYFAWVRLSRIALRGSRGVNDGTRSTPPPAHGRAPRMSREDACRVLGVGPDATPQQVLAEYRRLMKRVHPDAGGTEDLAARVNEAKAVLLGQ